MADLTFAFQHFSFDGSTIASVSETEATVTVSDADLVLTVGETVSIGAATYTYVGQFGGGIVLEQSGFFLILSDTDNGTGPFTIDETDYVFCFTRGTRIRTAAGERRIETLRSGDLIPTLDNGLQPIRWIGKSPLSEGLLAVRPDLRPIRIAAGALGNSAELVVSPHHRMHVTGWRAEVLFGQPQVLVAARDLVNDRTITVAPAAGGVEYWHILFERHELIWAEGALSESLHPDTAHDDPRLAEARAELTTLFPELERAGTGEPLRPTLTPAEARLL